MSKQHTQGHMKPGVSLVGGVEHFTVVPHGSEKTVVAMCGLVGANDESESIANARRISASWNACEGLSTEQIGLIADHHAKVEAQRDALLEAARTMSAALYDLIAQKPMLAAAMAGTTTLGNQRVQLMVAIKKVEDAL